jgi:hypothetical protein
VLVGEINVDAVLGDVNNASLQRSVDFAEWHMDDLGTIGAKQCIFGRCGLHADLQALEPRQIADLFLAVKVAQAQRDQRQHPGALYPIRDHLAERCDDFGIADRLLQVVLAAEDEVDRKNTRVRRYRRGVRGRGNGEIDVTRAQLL